MIDLDLSALHSVKPGCYGVDSKSSTVVEKIQSASSTLMDP